MISYQLNFNINHLIKHICENKILLTYAIHFNDRIIF
jgi:hypothetical protein